MSNPISGPAELAVARGARHPVLCHIGIPEGFRDEFAGGPYDDSALLEALEAHAGPVSVLIPAACAELVPAILSLPSWRSGQLFLYGTGEEGARAELEALEWLSWIRVRYVDLEYVPPRVVEDGPGHPRMVGGLGIVEIAEHGPNGHPRRETALPMIRLLPRYQSALVPPRIAAQQLAAEIERRQRAERIAQDLTASVSWRVTAPLRRLKRMRG